MQMGGGGGGGGGGDMSAEALMCQMSDVIGSLSGPSNFAPNSQFGGEWSSAAGQGCYRSVSQRFLEDVKTFSGGTANAGVAAADVLPALLVAMGLPVLPVIPVPRPPIVLGPAVNVYSMALAADQALYNNLALVGLAVSISTSIVETNQSNPTGGAGTQSAYADHECTQDAIKRMLQASAVLTQIHKSDAADPFWRARLGYFQFGERNYRPLPALVYQQAQTAQALQIQMTAPDFGAGAFVAAIPAGTTLNAQIEVRSLWMADPSTCGCQWPIGCTPPPPEWGGPTRPGKQ